MTKQVFGSSVWVMVAASASSAVYLGLAVIGRGGFMAYFAQPALVALAIILVMLVLAGLLSPASLSTGVREDRGNRWVFIVFAVVSFLSGYVPAYTDRIGFWTVDGDFVRWTGVVLFAAGGVLRLWPVFVLGHRFSGLVAIQPGHRLMTDGIYATIRNPSYLGLLINAVGWALAFRSVVGVLLVGFLLPALVARMQSEEALLRSQFGEAYDAYKARTWRLLPWFY